MIKEEWKAVLTKPAVVVIAAMLLLCGFVLYQVYSYTEEVDDVALQAEQTAKRSAALTIQNSKLARQNRSLIKKIDQEGIERRDENCLAAEGQHLAEINQIKRSYRFYVEPPPAFKDLLANPLVRQQLKEDIRAARNDQDLFGIYVPSYCDDPGYGRKEPDPKMPKQPAVVKRDLQSG